METETKAPTEEQNNIKRTSSSSLDFDSPHSPQPFHSPLRSEPADTPPYASPAGSPVGSPEKQSREKAVPLGSPQRTPPSRSSEKIPPLRSPEKSPQSVPAEEPHPSIDNSKAIVAINKATQFTPSPSPSPPHSLDDTSDTEDEKSLPRSTPMTKAKNKSPPKEEAKFSPENTVAAEEEKTPSPIMLFNRSVKQGAPQVMRKNPRADSGSSGGRSGAVLAILKRTRREELVKLAALGFRLSGVILSLISLSIMAADKTQGWSGDSYDRYKEYRYCLSVNVIAFVYSGFQACDLAYYLVKEKQLIHHHLRPTFDFVMDQVLAYLLISASSAAATRVDDWVSNWGRDEFTLMASVSVAMSFLAFLAFALSSLISGYNLFTRDSI